MKTDLKYWLDCLESAANDEAMIAAFNQANGARLRAPLEGLLVLTREVRQSTPSEIRWPTAQGDPELLAYMSFVTHFAFGQFQEARRRHSERWREVLRGSGTSSRTWGGSERSSHERLSSSPPVVGTKVCSTATACAARHSSKDDLHASLWDRTGWRLLKRFTGAITRWQSPPQLRGGEWAGESKGEDGVDGEEFDNTKAAERYCRIRERNTRFND